jgi:hypothetical protein
MNKNWNKLGIAVFLTVFASTCSSAPPVKTEAYAQLKNHRTFENDFPTVWKAIEEVFRNTKVTDRDPDTVSELDLRNKTKERRLKTDWTYGQSRDKYQEYKVNDLPKKVFLQERTRYTVDAHRVMGGVEVLVKNEEEVEKLNSDGSSAGFYSVDKPDTSRADEIVNKIANAILSAPPSGAAP